MFTLETKLPPAPPGDRQWQRPADTVMLPWLLHLWPPTFNDKTQEIDLIWIYCPYNWSPNKRSVLLAWGSALSFVSSIYPSAINLSPWRGSLMKLSALQISQVVRTPHSEELNTMYCPQGQDTYYSSEDLQTWQVVNVSISRRMTAKSSNEQE